MAQPSNCDDKCTSYDYCKGDGVFNMFIAGAECPDRHEAEEE
jgi:hypothetical protein